MLDLSRRSGATSAFNGGADRVRRIDEVRQPWREAAALSIELGSPDAATVRALLAGTA